MSPPSATAGNTVRWPYVASAFVAAALVLAFWHTAVQLVYLWSRDASYSHGYVIPLLAAIPAWLYVRRTGVPAAGSPGLGAMYLLGGGLVHIAAQVVVLPPLDFFALAMVLRGLAVIAGGRAWANGLTFPILFLFFMFPLPVTWTGYAALWLQDVVSQLSAALLDPFLTCYRRGNALYLAGVPQPLVVAEECSGLRQIVAFVAAGSFYAFFSGRSLAYRIALVLAAIPVAIAANVLRIVLMSCGAVWFGTAWLSGHMHDAPAVFSVPAGMGLYVLVGWALARFWKGAPQGGHG